MGTGLHAAIYHNPRTHLSNCVFFFFPIMTLAYHNMLLCQFHFNFLYLLDLDCLEGPVAQGVLGVLQAPQHCFQECQGCQGCPVAPEGQGNPGDPGGQVQTFFSLQIKRQVNFYVYTSQYIKQTYIQHYSYGYMTTSQEDLQDGVSGRMSHH